MNELQTTRTPEIIGAEIRHITYQVKCTTLYGGIELGRRLKEAKAAVPYGSFGEFLKNETEFSSSAAGRFMKLFDEYGPMLEGSGELFPTLGKVSVSNALRLLALPENEREEFVVEHNVENISTRELDKLIAERDEAIKRAEEAERTAADMDRARQAAIVDAEASREREKDGKIDLESAERKIAALKAENKELRERPVDVAVQIDEEAIKKAAEEATAEADEKWRKELDAAKQAGEQAKGEADKLRTALDEAKQAAEAAEKKVAGGNADYEAKINSLQKQLAMSGAEITTFKLLFDSWQQAFNRMEEALQAIPEENREKMTAAVKMVLEGQVSRV